MRNEPLILDGGFATALEARGVPLHPELWAAGAYLDRPDAVRDVHRAFAGAGADIVTTGTYQMTFEGLSRAGISGAEARSLMAGAVTLAREAGSVLVAASIGPYGASLCDGSEYRGDDGMSEQELRDFHRERLTVLAAAAPDYLACETLPSLTEARALLSLARDGFPPMWLSFACRNGREIADGTPIREVAAALDDARVFAVGINCTAPRHVAELVAHVRAVSEKPLVLYPNSGERWDARARRFVETPIRRFESYASEWRRVRGLHALGGCCRVGVDEIRALARPW